MRLWKSALQKAKSLANILARIVSHVRLADLFFVGGLWLLFDGISDYNLSLAKVVVGGLLFLIAVWAHVFQATRRPEKEQ